MSEVNRYSYSGPWFTRDFKLCVLASDYDAKAAECERLRKAVHDLQLFVQDSRGLKIISDALSPTEGAGAALPEGKL